MKTELIEFKNTKRTILRGILVMPERPKKGVIMMDGFGGCATTKKKSKLLADKFHNKNIASFRFDYTGLGLSDGDFNKITVTQMTDDLSSAYRVLKSKLNSDNISVIGHSLAGCAIANLISENIFKKIVLLAPALNQRELMRYWFAQEEAAKQNCNINITWDNFSNYFREDAFQTFSEKRDRMTRFSYVSTQYYRENKEKDYTDLLIGKDIFLVHGTGDKVVPLESLKNRIKANVLVKGGDHDLERPDLGKQWIDKVVIYISR